MTATACTLAAVLVLAAATPPATTDDCPLTDNRCKARRYERRAAKAPNATQRANYLYNAARSYVFVFDKTDDALDLCEARRAIDASLAVRDQPPAQRAIAAAMRDDLAARERQEAVTCKNVARRRRVKSTDLPLVTRRTAPHAPPALPADPVQTAGARDEATPSSTEREAVLPLDWDVGEPPRTMVRRPSEPVLTPVSGPRERALTAQGVRAGDHASEPHPGRGLLIAGGVTLGVGVALSAAAGVMGHRMIETRQQIFALDKSIDGYATMDQAARGEALIGDLEAMRPRTLALALAGGAAVLVAAVLASIGGRRIARTASRTALAPAPGGIVFHARF